MEETPTAQAPPKENEDAMDTEDLVSKLKKFQSIFDISVLIHTVTACYDGVTNREMLLNNTQFLNRMTFIKVFSRSFSLL